jgi:hypothetical protein
MDQARFSGKRQVTRPQLNTNSSIKSKSAGQIGGCWLIGLRACRIFSKITYRWTFRRHTIWRRCIATTHGAEAAWHRGVCGAWSYDECIIDLGTWTRRWIRVAFLLSYSFVIFPGAQSMWIPKPKWRTRWRTKQISKPFGNTIPDFQPTVMRQ